MLNLLADILAHQTYAKKVMGTLQGTDYTNWAGYAELACFAEVTSLLVGSNI